MPVPDQRLALRVVGADDAPPHKVEIVLLDYDAAREWVLRNRQYPSPSPIYVDTVLKAA
jgi:hypothetical protein